MASLSAFALLCVCGFSAAAFSNSNSRDSFSGGRIPNPNVDSDNDFGDADDDFSSPKINAWPDGVIPYVISSDISDSDAKKLRGELDFISQKTCVQFVPRRNEANYTLFKSGDKCSAPLGMSNNPVQDSGRDTGFGGNSNRDTFGSNSGRRDSGFGTSSDPGRTSFGSASSGGSRGSNNRFKRQNFGSSSNSGRGSSDDRWGSSSGSRGTSNFGSSNSDRDRFGSNSGSGSSFGSSDRDRLGSSDRDRFGGSSGSIGSSSDRDRNRFGGSYKSGASQVILGKSCFQTKRLARRLMNLIGIPHEASRPDRDQYVTINFDNIRSGYTGNINKYPASAYLPGVLDQPYDYASVTQYADADLARNKNTWAIKAKNTRSATTLGGDDFSKGDIAKISAAYRDQCPRLGGRG